MKIVEFVNLYNMHDSLLESVTIDKKNKLVRMGIDFCYWQQRGYDASSPETGLVYLEFSGVRVLTYNRREHDSDEIIRCVYDKSKDLMQIDVLSDSSGNIYSIAISADNVILKKAEDLA